MSRKIKKGDLVVSRRNHKKVGWVFQTSLLEIPLEHRERFELADEPGMWIRVAWLDEPLDDYVFTKKPSELLYVEKFPKDYTLHSIDVHGKILGELFLLLIEEEYDFRKDYSSKEEDRND